MNPPRSLAQLDDISALTERLDKLFNEKESYTKFLALRDSSAQQLLDLLQDLLDYENLSMMSRPTQRRFIKALTRLSDASKLHPRCCTLTDLERGKHLGGGSFSDVYNGVLRGQSVAIKVMRVFGKRNIEEVLREFGREALIWRQLSHPNLLPFFGLYYLDDRLCLVSPWMKNGDIRAFLKNEEQHNLDVALGLEHLHGKCIVHGDLKSDNIFVTPSFRACIADFGLSSIITTISSIQFTDSANRARGGTVRYQAPELHQGGHNDLRSDIYAFACVAYELFTGKLPFPELPTDGAVIDAVIKGRRPSQPASCSGTAALDDLWKVLQHCWEEQPERRPTCGQIVERLTGTVIQATATQSTPDWDHTSTSRFRRSFLGQPSLPSVLEIERIIFDGGLSPLLYDIQALAGAPRRLPLLPE
ncbi:kinase-like domain-containing protein [Mycena olivaceomarginata]|nr:kinase-like domain-containing protein [Mycena olivaceomarginata]